MLDVLVNEDGYMMRQIVAEGCQEEALRHAASYFSGRLDYLLLLRRTGAYVEEQIEYTSAMYRNVLGLLAIEC